MADARDAVVEASVVAHGDEDFLITLIYASGATRTFMGAEWDEQGDPLYDGEGLRNCLWLNGVPQHVLARKVRRLAPEWDPERDVPMIDSVEWRAADMERRAAIKDAFRRRREG